MAPKLSKNSKLNQITIIKFKRKKSTYVIALDLNSKSSLTLKNFKESLSQAIEESGGLVLGDEAEADTNDIGEDDIEVPKSEYIENEENDMMMEEIEKPDVAEDISPDALRLALPKDKTAPYENEWIEITDNSSISSLKFSDYDIIAFKHHSDDGFFITEAAYEE